MTDKKKMAQKARIMHSKLIQQSYEHKLDDVKMQIQTVADRRSLELQQKKALANYHETQKQKQISLFKEVNAVKKHELKGSRQFDLQENKRKVH